ncbi:MAG TPA: bifunctional nuclease family protein [Thermomicrobiales bacterium]|jgi:bifunctional DNase/RNase
MIETVVESIRVNLVTQNRVVFLKELHGDRYLPIWIGEFEAQAIAMELQGIASPRPLPYDLMKTIIGDLEARVDRILVTDLSQDVFYARIVIQTADRTIEVDSRPSDAIALAVRTGAPILVDESVMDRAGVSLDSEPEIEEEPAAPPSLEREASSSIDDERLSVFKEFINTLDMDDFERKRGN